MAKSPADLDREHRERSSARASRHREKVHAGFSGAFKTEAERAADAAKDRNTVRCSVRGCRVPACGDGLLYCWIHQRAEVRRASMDEYEPARPGRCNAPQQHGKGGRRCRWRVAADRPCPYHRDFAGKPEPRP